MTPSADTWLRWFADAAPVDSVFRRQIDEVLRRDGRPVDPTPRHLLGREGPPARRR